MEDAFAFEFARPENLKEWRLRRFPWRYTVVRSRSRVLASGEYERVQWKRCGLRDLA